jgi:hypothetical protein
MMLAVIVVTAILAARRLFPGTKAGLPAPATDETRTVIPLSIDRRRKWRIRASTHMPVAHISQLLAVAAFCGIDEK